MAPKRKRPGTASKDTPATEQAVDSTTTNGDSAPSDPPQKRTRSSGTRTKRAAEPDNEDSIGLDGENGEAESMRMEPPPKAGIVDPVGYHTNPPPTGRAVRVYADGVFDLFHLGHMRQLQQAKLAFDNVHLIVGVTGDEETHKRKGLTVLSAKERAESVRNCRWVDEVVEDCPWIIDVDFLQKHKIDYVAHDDIPYGASEGDDIYKPIKERGMFLVTQRTEGVSTTGIITKIVRDYEQYIARQFKRGTSRQELNVSWLKKNEMDIKRHVAELRDNIRTNWTTTGQELSRELRQFWTPSRPGSPSTSLSHATSSRIASKNSANHLFASGGGRGDGASSASIKERNKNLDFAAGYAMGLIGGVKGWMQGSDRRHLSDSRGQSPNGETSGDQSPAEGASASKNDADSLSSARRINEALAAQTDRIH